MTSTMTRLVAALACLAAVIFLSACNQSESDVGTNAQREQQPVVTGKPAGFNADDIAFATNMIPHHQQAIEMSGLVPDRSANPDLQNLASKISAAQGPEIEVMKVLLVQWKENPDTNDGSGHGGHAAMQGMVDEATMARLASLQGSEFDTLWLESMIGHHQGAIETAKAEIANGANVDAKKLANNIVTTQQTEIDQMKNMKRG